MGERGPPVRIMVMSGPEVRAPKSMSGGTPWAHVNAPRSAYDYRFFTGFVSAAMG